MAVSKQKKAEILSSLVEQVKNAKSIGFASTKGVTVAEFADLRKKLREVGASYTLAKKTLIVKAVKEALDLDLNLADLEGQIGMVCSNDDAIAGLSKVNDFIKATEKEQKMTWSISIFEGKLQDKAETKVIASMPSRETLLSRLVGSMKSPISSLARFFDAAAKDIEAKGKTKVGELEGKKEEKATEAETPAE
ncbi:50S ribosomal protein L10 [Candidatus Gracilibacteria bacterium HOT-871]|nr:50S ribosomal protein L10 [Candidatus Gracilibacteria bacterium HOT-871]MBB1564861.1 50S ribosomal protein L10 [Candidatus Gracilibacteria bacterium]